MLIFALMGDKVHYDGMLNMYNHHRSTGDNDLMSWVITASERSSQDGDSATDGDFDIAYSMILADKQWGSSGGINYLAKAKRMITSGIKQSDMSRSTHRTMMGDWDTNRYTTRASDWMPDHMRVFKSVTNDLFWNQSAGTVYSLISHITNHYSSHTGLMPDFVIAGTPRPAPADFLEGENDGNYFYNACRYPWRITLDYAHFGTPAAKTAMNKVVNWLKAKTHNNPRAIKSGFRLNGSKLSDSDYYSNAFAAPFITASIVSSSNQLFLNRGWDAIRNSKESYYEDTIALLNMLVISGNWWNPAEAASTPPPAENMIKNGTFSNGKNFWNFEASDGGAGYIYVRNGILKARLTKAGTEIWSNQLFQGGLSVKQGKKYKIDFNAKAGRSRPIQVIVAMDRDPWTLFSDEKHFNITTRMRHYSFSFTSTRTYTRAQLEFDLGLNFRDVYLDNVVMKQVN